MSKRIVIEPRADADLIEAYDWYEDKRFGLGSDFLLCVEVLQAIAERPRSFPVVRRTARRALIRRFPYFLLFVDQADHVSIVGAFHTSRDPAVWQRRLR